MTGYLEEYGVQDARRGKIIKRILIAAAGAIVIGTLLFVFFRNFSERRVANSFLDAVKAKDYQKAYTIWGCTPAAPCRDYNNKRFMDDWGPNGVYAKASEGKYSIEDACGDFVVFTLESPGAEPVGIFVNREDKLMGFAPWPRCPGRHLHLWEFLKSRFSGSAPQS